MTTGLHFFSGQNSANPHIFARLISMWGHHVMSQHIWKIMENRWHAIPNWHANWVPSTILHPPGNCIVYVSSHELLVADWVWFTCIFTVSVYQCLSMFINVYQYSVLLLLLCRFYSYYHCEYCDYSLTFGTQTWQSILGIDDAPILSNWMPIKIVDFLLPYFKLPVMVLPMWYTLWWTNIAMENGHRNSGFSH